jgi:hypothetical protein
MADYVLIDGDTATFQPTFGPATVTVQPGTLTGSGDATFGGKALCIDGDEKSVAVPGCPYTTASHTIAGSGTLKIAALGSDQRATARRSNGKPVLLKGGSFTATFEVEVPAQQPQPAPSSPVPDTMTQYSGSGTFTTANSRLRSG